MGLVYRARRPDMGDRAVAIKIPFDVDERLRQRFAREIAASARLQHENIVRAFDCGEAAGRPYLVMELVDGASLAEVVEREHPLPVARVVKILRGIAAGLAHAEGQGIVNRDIKPENVLLADDDTPKVLDYGLALIRGLEGAPDRVTRFGVVLGTAAFMAPEQIRDPHSVDIQADVYALGCTAFCALTRHTPFAGDASSILRQHGEAERPSVRWMRPDVPGELASFLMQVMAIDPAARPRPRDMVNRLEVWRSGSSQRLPEGQSDGNSESGVGDLGPMARAFDAVEADRGERSFSENPEEPPPIVGEILGDGTDGDASEVTRYDPTPRPGDFAPLAIDEPDTGVILGEILEESPLRDTSCFPDGSFDEPLPDKNRRPVGFFAPSSAGPAPHEPAVIAGELLDELPSAFDRPAVVGTISNAGAAPEMVSDEIVTLPLDAIVEASDEEPDEPPPIAPDHERAGPTARRSGAHAGRPRAAQRRRLVGVIALSAVFVLVSLAAVIWIKRPANPATEWAKIMEAYTSRGWKEAERGLTSFAERFPEDSRAADVPFLLEMCEVGRGIYSRSGDPVQAWQQLQRLFQSYRDKDQYATYNRDLFDDLQELVDQFITIAESSEAPTEPLERAREALDLQETVARSLSSENTADALAAATQRIQRAELAVQALLRKRQVLADLSAVAGPEMNADARDEVYARVQGKLDDEPKLAGDSEIKAALVTAYRSESERVRYEPTEANAVDSGPAEMAEELFVVWGTPLEPSPSVKLSNVVYGVARGVVYAFQTTGEFLWARRLGIDATRLPLRLPGGSSVPDLLLVVSAANNELLALSPRTGEPVWRYRVEDGQSLAANITVARWRPDANSAEIVRGLLPTANGEIHVLELSSGRRLGIFHTGLPLTVGGTFDPALQLAFFAADGQRILAIDPSVVDQADSSRAPAPSILLTRHPSGSMRGPPVVVGEYLLFTESSDLESSRVVAYKLKPGVGFVDPAARPLKEFELSGWLWFTPKVSPDRLLTISDTGHLGLFGVNLDNDQEALYPLLQDNSGGLPRVPVTTACSALLIHADENYVWFSAGGVVRQFAMDIVHQRAVPLWPESDSATQVTGIPQHEAQWDAPSERLFLTLRSPSADEMHLVAVEGQQGAVAWTRHLGFSAVGEPLLSNGKQVVFLDQSGGTLSIELQSGLPSENPDASPRLALHMVEPPPQDAQEANLILHDVEGRVFYCGIHDGGNELSVRQITLGEQMERGRRRLSLPAPPLAGRPAILGGQLVVPGSDGRLHRIPLEDTATPGPNEQPFEWAAGSAVSHGQRRALVFPLEEQSILVIDDRRIRRLEFRTDDGISQWKQQGETTFADASVVGEPVRLEKQLFLTDQQSTLYRFPSPPGEIPPDRWQLPGRITAGPFLRDGKVMVIEDERRIVCFDPHAAPGSEPLWTTTDFPGRVCGVPTLAANSLVVTDDRGGVSGVRLKDGEVVGRYELPSDAVPSGAALPFGSRRVLVPLADGTLRWQSVRGRAPPGSNAP